MLAGATLLASLPVVAVADCPPTVAPSLRALAALELSDLTAPPPVTLRCAGLDVVISAGSRARTMPGVLAAEGGPRQVALAAAELARTPPPTRPKPSAEPPPVEAPAEPPAPRIRPGPEPKAWWLSAQVALRRSQAHWAVGGAVAAGLGHRWWWGAVEGAATTHRGRHAGGETRTATASAALFGGPRFALGDAEAQLGAGARLGWAWLGAEAVSGWRAQAADGAWGGPLLRLGAAWPRGALGLAAHLEAGWAPGAVRGRVAGQVVEGVGGPWLTLGAGLAY